MRFHPAPALLVLPLLVLPLLILSLPFLLVPSVAAQEPARSQEDELREFRIVRRVDRVTTPLIVQDRARNYIDDLRRDEIEIYDNGERQTLTAFEIAEQPISAVFLFDTSLRIKPLLERVRKGSYVFTESILGPFGEAAIITFDDEVRIQQDFTPNHDLLLEVIQEVKAEGALTRLADGLHLAVERLLNRPLGRRRLIVVVSEERDEGSETELGEALRLAQLGEIGVYSVLMSKFQSDWLRRQEESAVRRSPYPPGVSHTPPAPGSLDVPSIQNPQGTMDLKAALEAIIHGTSSKLRNTMLETYAVGTAGVKYSPSSQAEFDQALHEIGQDIRSQYLLTYRPSNGNQQGLHKIEVRVTRKRTRVRYRPGYFIGVPPKG